MAWGTCNFYNGSTTSVLTLYYNYSTGGQINYWASSKSASAKVTAVAVPTQTGSIFAKYLTVSTSTIPHYDVTDSYGNLATFAYEGGATMMAVAIWRDYAEVTLSGGVGGFGVIYRRCSDGACFSDSSLTTQISSVSLPRLIDHKFSGYTGNSTQIVDAAGSILPAMATITVDRDFTATATWLTSFRTFGEVNDYFYLGSATLVPVDSDSGDNRQHTCAYNATTSSTAADNEVATETSGVWRNPRVTYRVVGDMTLAVTLGAAFAGVADGTGASSRMTTSGYMITAVEIHTAIGEPPTVTVSAVANEGYVWNADQSVRTVAATPAVKTYPISIAISARHRPQNLMSSLDLTGSGDLHELSLTARADPTVVAEDGMPCASDISHGAIEVAASVATYDNEPAPTAGTGFAKTSEPAAHSGTGYKTYRVSVRKELT